MQIDKSFVAASDLLMNMTFSALGDTDVMTAVTAISQGCKDKYLPLK